jgi:hypothetical protein
MLVDAAKNLRDMDSGGRTSGLRLPRMLAILFVAAVASSMLSAPAADAQSAGDYTPDEARAVFVDAGYDVGPITTWNWAVPPVSAFRVEDPQRGRVLLVQIYADEAAAPGWLADSRARGHGRRATLYEPRILGVRVTRPAS